MSPSKDPLKGMRRFSRSSQIADGRVARFGEAMVLQARSRNFWYKEPLVTPQRHRIRHLVLV